MKAIPQCGTARRARVAGRGDVGDGARDGAPWRWCESGSSIGVSRSLARMACPVRDTLPLSASSFLSPAFSLLCLARTSCREASVPGNSQSTEKRLSVHEAESHGQPRHPRLCGCANDFLRRLRSAAPPPEAIITNTNEKKRGSALYYPALSLPSPSAMPLRRKRDRTGIRTRVRSKCRKEGIAIKVWGGLSDKSRT